MNGRRVRSVLSSFFLVPLAILSFATHCNKCGGSDDDDDKLPTAAPTVTSAPVPTVDVGPEDAGIDASEDAADAADADADAKVVTGGDPTGVRACCAALRQNAKSATPQNQGAYLLAAGACDAVVNSPQGRQGLTAVRNMLRGAGLPSECR